MKIKHCMLQAALAAKPMKALRQLAHAYGLPVQATKAQLAEGIAAHIRSKPEETMGTAIASLSRPLWERFQDTIEKGETFQIQIGWSELNEERLRDSPLFATRSGTRDGFKGLLVSIPDEIRDLYLNSGIDWKALREPQDFYEKTALAAVHLYGVVTTDEFMDLFTRYFPQSAIGRNELLQFLDNRQDPPCGYLFTGTALVASLYVELREEPEIKKIMRNVLEDHAGRKRWYPADKDAFLRFVEPLAATPPEWPSIAGDFLEKHGIDDDESRESLLEALLDLVQTGNDMADLFLLLDDWEVVLENGIERARFASLLEPLFTKTRLMALNGNRRDEIEEGPVRTSRAGSTPSKSPALQVTLEEAIGRKNEKTVRTQLKSHFPDAFKAGASARESRELLVKAILDDPETAVQLALTFLDFSVYQAFLTAIDEGEVTLAPSVPEDRHIIAIAATCYLFDLIDDDQAGKTHLVIPDEIRAIYLGCSGRWGDFRKETDAIQSFAEAATRLYGVLTVGEAHDLMKRYSKDFTIDIGEFSTILFLRQEPCLGYLLEGDQLIDAALLLQFPGKAPFEIVRRFLAKRGDTPRWYAKDLREFLSNSWRLQELHSPATRAFCTFLTEQGIKDTEQREAFLDDLLTSIQLGENVSEHCLRKLEENGIELDDEALGKLAEILPDLNNNTRMMLHNGHTPAEMVQILAAGQAYTPSPRSKSRRKRRKR